MVAPFLSVWIWGKGLAYTLLLLGRWVVSPKARNGKGSGVEVESGSKPFCTIFWASRSDFMRGQRQRGVLGLEERAGLEKAYVKEGLDTLAVLRRLELPSARYSHLIRG